MGYCLHFKQPERYDPLGSYMNGCTFSKVNFYSNYI